MADDGLAPMKTCTKCGETKPATVEFFGKSKLGKHGLKSRCRPCKVEAERGYNRAYCRSYYQANRDKMNTASRLWYAEADKAELNQRSRERYKYLSRHILEKQRAWRAKHPERARDIVKQYESRNPDVRRVIKANRRARELSASGAVRLVDLEALRSAQAGLCRWCKGPLGRAHLDHVVPLARGGSSEPSNLVLACAPCNLKKASKLIEELGWS